MRTLLILMTTAVTLSGCSTLGEEGLNDFNSKFGQALSTLPKYRVDKLAENRFQVVVYQGSATISERTTRSAALQRAAFVVMEDHCIQAGSKLGDYSISNQADSWGYMNLLAIFSCLTK